MNEIKVGDKVKVSKGIYEGVVGKVLRKDMNGECYIDTSKDSPRLGYYTRFYALEKHLQKIEEERENVGRV